MRKTSAPPTQQHGPVRPRVSAPPTTGPKNRASRMRAPTPPAPECIFEASEIGLLLEPEDDVLEPSAIGMVLDPSRVEAVVTPEAPRREAPRMAADVGFTVERSRHGTAAPERRWDLVETAETGPAPEPVPKPRRTPRRNPYRAPESQWDARIEEPKVPPRRRFALWTAVSAGASALACCVAFLVAAPAETAPAQGDTSEPVVIRYDDDLLDPPSMEIAPAAIADDAVTDRRSHALALALRGRTNMLAGRTKMALAQFHEALEYNAQNRLALAQLGEWHLEHGRAAKAAEYLRRAVRVEPRDGKAHHLLGRAYERLGRPQKAEFHHRAAAKHGHSE